MLCVDAGLPLLLLLPGAPHHGVHHPGHRRRRRRQSVCLTRQLYNFCDLESVGLHSTLQTTLATPNKNFVLFPSTQQS